MSIEIRLNRKYETRKIRWKSRWGRVNGSFCDQHGKKKWDRKGGRQEAKAKEKIMEKENHGKGEKQGKGGKGMEKGVGRQKDMGKRIDES